MAIASTLTSSDSPFVSICCPTFNHENFIEDTLNGFLIQKTNFPVEILVNDDCSTDRTTDIIKEYEKQFPEIIKPVYQPTNQYSKGIKPIPQVLLPRCKGKYVALCDGDDFWTDPNKLQTQIDFLETNSELSMCYTNFSYANEKGEVIYESGASRKFKKTHIDHLQILEYFTPRIFTIVFRTTVLQNRVPHEISLVPNGDIFLCALLIQQAPAAYLDFISGCHRLNKNSVYATKPILEKNEMTIKTLNVLKKYFVQPDEQRAINSHLSRKKIIEAYCQLRKLKITAALRAMATSLKYSRKPYREVFKLLRNNKILWRLDDGPN